MPDKSKSFERDVCRVIRAAEDLGLDFFDVEFRLCPAEMISLVAAYAVPTRFPHWSFGKKFHKLMLQHRYGIARIHELAYFSDPCQAFVLESNSPLENKLVAAHVIAHSDFFKNNRCFFDARRNAAKMMAGHSRFIQECMEAYGRELVESFLDAALALRQHIDPSYEPESGETGLEKDLLLYIVRHSCAIADWQKNILAMVREESRYFSALFHTRFLNEGWAAYWHTRILREMDLSASEGVEFALVNAAALEANGRMLNPYRLGVDMFSHLDKTIGVSGMLALRREENDVSFFQKYLDEEMTARLGLVVNMPGEDHTDGPQRCSPGEVRQHLLHSLANCGSPHITVDAEGSTEDCLSLKHWFDGTPLRPDSVRRTLEQIYPLWAGKICLNTARGFQQILYSFNGTRHFRRIL